MKIKLPKSRKVIVIADEPEAPKETGAYQIEPARCTEGKLSAQDVLNLPDSWGVDDNTVYEVKEDGRRYFLQVRPNGAKINYLTSRRIGKNTGRYVEKQDSEPKMRDHYFVMMDDTIFDGEICAVGDSTTSNEAATAMATGQSIFKVWDIIRHRGDDLRGCMDTNRRRLLEQLSKHFPKWMLLEWRYKNPKPLLRDVLARGGEGIVQKKLNAPYGEGWLKIKKEKTYDVIITGCDYSDSAKYAPHGWIKNVHFSQYRNGVLTPCGQTSGMDEQTRDYITKNIKRLVKEQQVIELIANLRFPSGALRHPRFLPFKPGQVREKHPSFRYDKNPQDCIWTDDH